MVFLVAEKKLSFFFYTICIISKQDASFKQALNEFVFKPTKFC